MSRSSHRPRDCLTDIIENADRIATYLAGLDPETFSSNGLVGDAVERCLERICEAAHRLGEQAELLIPGQPWADIRGMGNRLRHAYDRLDAGVLWHTARRDVPRLANAARAALITLDQPATP